MSALPVDTWQGGVKILYLVTEDWYFCSHRLPIARAARDAGCEVLVATRVQRHADLIEREGFRLVPLSWQRHSIHPWAETRALFDVLQLYRREKPDLVHHVALKPFVYGSLAARLTRLPAVVNTVAGLGYVFSSQQRKARMLSPVLRFALRSLLRAPNSRVILQNPDDEKTLTRITGVAADRIALIRGSGVDVDRFVPTPEPKGTPVVTMVSRMLWNKGVGELVEAARRLEKSGSPVRINLVGLPDPENPASIPERQLEAWQADGLVEWHGYRDDIPDVWVGTNIAVLPSYYGEGVPKALLEAAACGRAIITTDTPGCREIVRHEDNGLLVPVNNVEALAGAIHRLAADDGLRTRMGKRGREIVTAEFNESLVVRQTLDVYRSTLGFGGAT